MASPEDVSAYENYPLQPPPPGQVSNFDNPESRGPAIVILCSVFIGTMWPILLLRLYSKVWVIRRFGWDDACAILAAIGATTFGAGVIWTVNHYIFGPHEWDVRAKVVTSHGVKIDNLAAGIAMYSVTMLFAKVALFLLYYQVFSLDRWTRIAIYLGISITSLLYLALGIANLILCIPWRDESWTSSAYGQRCSQTVKLVDFQGVLGLVSDLYLFVTPLPVLYGLRMSLRKKIGITAVFLTGLIAIVASAIGLYFRVQMSMWSDVSWKDPPATGLGVVEATIGVICGSVPYLPAYFRHHSAKFSPIIGILGRIRCGYKNGFENKYVNQPLDKRNSSPKGPTPQDHQMETALGTVQREGKFVNPGGFSRIWDEQSTMGASRSETLHSNKNGPTRREYYEGTESSRQQETRLKNRPECEQDDSKDNSKATATESSSRHRGYWDLMSIFRTTKKDPTNQSEMQLMS